MGELESAAAVVRRERRVLFDGVRAEIHPYDVTVEKFQAGGSYAGGYGGGAGRAAGQRASAVPSSLSAISDSPCSEPPSPLAGFPSDPTEVLMIPWACA